MAHPFEIAHDLEVDATPEQVWDAIATGPGMDSWFMGRSEVEPREGGTARWSIGDYHGESTVTHLGPAPALRDTGPEGPDGSFHRFDYRIEDRGAGRTTVRYVHSGMLAARLGGRVRGDEEGDPMYLEKLVEYLTHFSGRFAVRLDAHGPNVADRERAMAGFRRRARAGRRRRRGRSVRFTPTGCGRSRASSTTFLRRFLGVRSNDAIYRFIHGSTASAMVGHHLFADGVDAEAAAARLADLAGPAVRSPAADGGPSARRTWRARDRRRPANGTAIARRSRGC